MMMQIGNSRSTLPMQIGNSRSTLPMQIENEQQVLLHYFRNRTENAPVKERKAVLKAAIKEAAENNAIDLFDSLENTVNIVYKKLGYN